MPENDGLPEEIDELHVRTWFLHTDFDEAYRTYHIVGGIIAARELQEKKKPHGNTGRKRTKPAEQPTLPGVKP